LFLLEFVNPHPSFSPANKCYRDIILNTERQQFDGYYLIPNDLKTGSKMVLEGPWKAQYEDAVNKNNITGLRLSVSNGWRDTNIEFIHSLSTIRDLEIYNWDVTDISAIELLPQLVKVSLECNYRKSINFTKFTRLQYCFLRWRPKSDSIFSAPSLKALNIVNYPYEDLQPLQALHQLTELKLTSNKLRSLAGISSLKALLSIDLYRCAKLESLNDIQSASQLTTIELESCKKLGNLKPLSALTKLTKVSLNNCGKLQSLQPLKSCGELSELFFIEDTNIEDGDTGIFTDLPTLKTMWFANRKHYSHKREAVQEIIETR